MPEGHSVHRIARQFARELRGRAGRGDARRRGGSRRVPPSSTGTRSCSAKAVGKQMFLEFDHGLWLRVHLGIYGAWDFAGDITVDATMASANGRMGQTNQRGTGRRRARGLAVVDRRPAAHPAAHGRAGEARRRPRDLPAGADRRGAGAPAHRDRVRRPARADRLRGADHRGGATARSRSSAPIRWSTTSPRARSASSRSCARSRPRSRCCSWISRSVSGIGNVYRAELLFRARLDPFTPGQGGAGGDRARALARLGAPAAASASRPARCSRWTTSTRRRTARRSPPATTGTGSTTAPASRAACAEPPIAMAGARRPQALLVPDGPGVISARAPVGEPADEPALEEHGGREDRDHADEGRRRDLAEVRRAVAVEERQRHGEGLRVRRSG